MTRKEITASLLEAVTYYYVKKLYSVHPEFGIERWGRRRLDALCMNFKCEFIGIETKSCLSDYREDGGKWRCYLPYVNKLRKYGASDTFLRAKWNEFPLRAFKIIEGDLKTTIGRVARKSITLPDLTNKLQDIVDAYAGRVPEDQYKKILLKMLSDFDPNNVMADEYVTLRLTR